MKNRPIFWLVPSTVLFSIYVLAPIFATLWISLSHWDGINGLPMPACWIDESFSCFDHYLWLMKDPIFLQSLGNNLIWLIGFMIAPALGLGFAFCFHTKGLASSLFKTSLFTPMVFSLVVVGMVWNWFLQPGFGLMEGFLKAIGFLGSNEYFEWMAEPMGATLAPLVAAVWAHMSYCMIIYLAGLSQIDPAQIEAGKLDGLRGMQLFRWVIWPSLKPSTTLVTLVTIVGALRTFEIVAMMTAGGPAQSSNVLALYMYQQTFENFDYGYGATLSMVLFALSGLIISVLYWIGQRGSHATA